jgi:hypothetical protein
MWYRLSKTTGYEKTNPSYESKMIAYLATEELRDLLAKQLNYNPSPKELESKVRRLFKHLEEKYGNIANVRLETKGKHLGPFIKEVVHDLFSKKNARKN